MFFTDFHVGKVGAHDARTLRQKIYSRLGNEKKIFCMIPSKPYSSLISYYQLKCMFRLPSTTSAGRSRNIITIQIIIQSPSNSVFASSSPHILLEVFSIVAVAPSLLSILVPAQTT